MKTDSALLTKVSEFAEAYKLFDTKNLIVGVSGGPDSIALITILSELMKETRCPKLYAVHINHGIREESGFDRDLTVNYCKSLGIPCKVYEFDVPAKSKELGRSLEETGRILRRQAFADFCSENGISSEDYRIALAHHKDDLAETMLMNLFRGSGLEGLVSPEAISGCYIRPLLCVSKQELIGFLENRGISYAVDKTNFESDCTRNKWRNEIIPNIGEVSIKKPIDALSDTYSLLSADMDFINSQVDSVYKKIVLKQNSCILCKCEDVNELHKAVKSRIIRKLWEEKFGNLTDFGNIHVTKCEELISSDIKHSRSIDLSFGHKAFVANGYFGFCSEDELTIYMCEIARLMGFVVSNKPICDIISNTTKIPQYEFQLDAQIVENSGELEYNNLSWYFPVCGPEDSSFVITNNLLNMRFNRAGSSYSKAIKDILADLKVPKEARPYVVALVKDDEVLWLPNVGHARGFTNSKSRLAFMEDKSNSADIKYLIKVSIVP